MAALWAQTPETLAAAPARPSGKAPFRMLFSNDTTNILTCESPYHGPQDKGLTDAMIRASVDEAAVEGMDAQLLQPGMSWLPWWPNSKVVPLEGHLQWFEQNYGVKPSGAFLDYVRAGGDMVKVFSDEAHAKNRAAFVSFRLNDLHGLDQALLKTPGHGRYAMSFAKFYVENPQYRLGTDEEKTQAARLQNWLLPEVRNYKFKLIEEVCERYPLEGIELDFMRWPIYFPEGTPPEQTKAAMTDFIKRVREMLNRTATDGKYRWLSVRIPASPEQWDAQGIDPAAFYAAGADIFNVSNSYCTTQQNPVALLHKLVPDATVVLELTHTVLTWKVSAGSGDNSGFRRSTKEALETTARLAYARGADGVSFFNFVYYRPFGPLRDKRGPFMEPPFDWLGALSSPEKLKDAPLYFFYAPNTFGGQIKGRDLWFKPGEHKSFSMDMLPFPADQQGRFRLQVITANERGLGENDAPEDVARGAWRVRINGQELKALPPGGELYPFETDIRAGFGSAAQYLNFDLPVALVKDGANQVEVWYERGKVPLMLRFADAWAQKPPADAPAHQ